MHGLVARSGVLVAEGKAAAAERIAAKQLAAHHGGAARCAGAAVIDLGDIAAGHTEGRRKDVARGAGLVGDAVVAHVRTAVAAAERGQLVGAGVLVGKAAAGGHLHEVASDQAGIGGAREVHRGTGRAVVRAVGHGQTADGQCLGRDGGRGGGLVGEDIVGDVGAAVAAGERHGLAVAHVLVAEQTCGDHGHVVAADQSTAVIDAGGVDRGAQSCVIDLVDPGDATHRHGLGHRARN